MSANSSLNMTISATMSAAEFRAFGAFLASVFDAGGFARTADTGQIDWTTVNYPGTNSTSAGYEIRAFSDALQATAPIVIKLDYRRGPGATYVEIILTIGTGSNGSGTITGTRYTGAAGCYFGGAAASTWNLYVSASTNRFAIFFGNGTTANTATLFAVERTIDSTRARTAEGVVFTFLNVSGTPFNIYIPATGTVPAAETGSNTPGACLAAGSQTTGLNADGNVAVYPFFYFGIGDVKPCTNIAGVYNSDFTNFATPTVTLLGSTQVMLKIAPSMLPAAARGALPTAANFVHLMRYD